MDIGTQIKKLRRERDITQEQLAEYLNISVSAVSQWECGKTAPDISQLPILANIFEVSADAILGINIDMKEEKINEIYTSAYNYAVEGFHEKAIKTLRNGLAEYPNNYKLMARLITELYCTDERGSNELSSLCEKILNGCTDNGIRAEILPIICGEVYPNTGRREEAIELAKSLPIYQETSNELLTKIYTGDKLTEQLQINIMALTSTLTSNILDITDVKHDNGIQLYEDDEKLAICQKIVNIMKIIFETGDYYYHSQYVKKAHDKMLLIYAKRKDTDNTLAQLENCAEYAVMFDTYDQKAHHSSLLSRGMETTGYFKESPYENHSLWLSQEILNPRYDFIRDDPRFIAVQTTLKKAADV